MYLTKISMPIREKAVRNALSNNQLMHRMLCGLYGTSREKAGLLYRIRIEKMCVNVYMYSAISVKQELLLPFMTLVGCRDITGVVEKIRPGTILRFDLLASPAKKVAGGKNSRRVMLRNYDDRCCWVEKRIMDAGCTVLSMQENDGGTISFSHSQNKGGNGAASSKRYVGVMRVDSPATFCDAVAKGLGPYKAYGCGMLMFH